MENNVVEVKRRLFALLHDSNLVLEYIREYGPVIDIKSIKEFKEKKVKAARVEVVTTGKDPVYAIKVKCPVCNHDDIDCYELRAKSQKITQNKFLVPVYEGAMGYVTVDYLMDAVTVCPRCLFASPDKKDFNRFESAGHTEVKSQLSTSVLMTMQEKIGERQAVVNMIHDYEGYFRRPRIEDAAIASYKLAMMRAHVEAWYEQPYSLYKLGSYLLRIAKIIKDGGGDNTAQLKEAVGFLEESFKTSNCPSEEIEMQVVYLLVALSLKIADQTKAGSYMSFFGTVRNNRLVEMKADPKLSTTVIDKWTAKTKLLWEDRDRPDLFRDE
jgi:uncharacterized protein (DUF2225 family)